MKKIIRYLLSIVVVAIVFLVASVAIFVAVFDANDYKQDLSDLVREQTGRELEFHGDVSLTIYPALGMKLGAMSFSNAAGFGARPMIKVGEASISVDMASLITLAPEIDRLVLRDLDVNLVRNKAGVNNWDDLLPKADASAAAGTSSGAAPEAVADGGVEIRGAFGGLDLQNIKLSWQDDQAGTKYEITDLDIGTGRIAPNEAFPMTLHLDARGSGDLNITFDLRSDIEYLIEQQRLTLSNLALKLNEFEIGGRVQLADFVKPTPSLRFELASQNLDVDALLDIPPATPPSAADGMQADAAEDVQIKLPMQTLRDLDIDGSIRIAQLKAQNLHMSDVAVAIKAQNGVVGLKPVTLNAYGGKVMTAVVIDVNSNLPKYGIEESVQAVRVGELLRDFTGEETISGNFDASAKLDTSGEWLSELKRNLNGTMKLSFLDGALNGFNVRHSIDTAKARLGGQEPPPLQNLKTDFSELNLSGVIRNGVFSSDDLKLQAPLLRVGGKGTADLNTEVVDYLVRAKLVGTVEGQQGGGADQLAGLEIPVSIKGPFTGPEIDVLLDEMLKARADAEKAKLKAEIEAQKEALKQQIAAEKKALEESKKRELEQQLEIEKAKAKDKLGDKLKQLLE
ncbi:MAG: AsmA family protein [Gammaproteobacteria bacterium]|nr:AsmA family protein [Gammaproteobacteria bacterium]